MRSHRWRSRARRAALLGGVWVGAAALLSPGAAPAQQGPFVYVPNLDSDSVTVIDTPTNTVVPPAIPVNGLLLTAAVRGDQAFVYVTNANGGNVSVIDTASNTVAATVGVGSGPHGVAVSPDGTRAYVANADDGSVSVINTATNTVVATVGVGVAPNGVAFRPDGTRAYVTNEGASSVSVIDTATNAVVATVGVGTDPFGVAVSPDGTRAYVTNGGAGSVTVIDIATNTVAATANVGNRPQGVAVSPDGTRIYVTNANDNNVSVIDTATNLVVATVAVGSTPNGVAFSPDGTRAYVSNPNSGNVSVIDTATNTVAATIPLGTVPYSLGICSNGNALLAAGRTFTARTSGALACTLASGPTGSPGPVFTGGTLQIAGASIVSALPILLQAAGGTIDTNGNSATLSGTISGPGGLTKIGVGTLRLEGINSYGGNTNVNGGTLIVDGSIALSALTTVNPGGTLGGNGTVGNTIINGGTLSPGTSIGTLTVSGSLVMTAASSYIVEVSPTNADRTNVTGTATLGGTVQAVFAPGSYVTRTYTILASAGLGGSTFGGLATSNLPAGFNASLSYTGNDVVLNLVGAIGGVGGLNQNQRNVAGALNSFFNNGGALPPNFVGVFGLTGGNLANALTLLSGEAATGAQQGAFQLTGQFLGIMLDPFVDGRGGIGGSPAIGFAPEREPLPGDVALAYAKAMKAPVTKAPVKAPSFEQRWTAWGGAYGGHNRTAGDPAVVGSHDLAARTAGFAAGLDYHVSRDAVFGFALAGGGTDWSLAQGLGGGKSDAIQAGAYAATRAGPAYLAASLAVANHWMSTDRTAFAADHLTASFNAWSLGARVEGGYRFATALGGVTPYAAGQAQSFRTPGYSESDVNGGGFALSYDARTATAVRSELGARFDHLAAVTPEAVLTLRGRLAWAHDWTSDPTRAAVFQALPGASFVVNGAAPAQDSALVSAGSELRLANGVTLSGKLDGEFARRSSTYAGTGTVRVSW